MSNLHTFHIIKYLSSLHFQGFELNTSLAETDEYIVWIKIVFNLSGNITLTNKLNGTVYTVTHLK